MSLVDLDENAVSWRVQVGQNRAWPLGGKLQVGPASEQTLALAGAAFCS